MCSRCPNFRPCELHKDNKHCHKFGSAYFPDCLCGHCTDMSIFQRAMDQFADELHTGKAVWRMS